MRGFVVRAGVDDFLDDFSDFLGFFDDFLTALVSFLERNKGMVDGCGWGLLGLE